MRALIGLVLLAGAGYGGVQQLSQNWQGAFGGAPEAQATALQPVAAGLVFQTVATSGADGANRPDGQAATGTVDPNVTAKPVVPEPKPPSGKAARAPKSKQVGIAKRPGFRLSCTAGQKLDSVKQKCVALKSAAVGHKRV